jgi:hypothetical protein
MGRRPLHLADGVPCRWRSPLNEGLGCTADPRRSSLHQIPLVAVEVLEHSYCSVFFCFWLTDEVDTCGSVGVKVSPEVVCVEKQEDSAARLVTNPRSLMLICGASQQQA